MEENITNTQSDETRRELERREALLAERERDLAERELRAMAAEWLAERGLPRELADAACYRDETSCQASLEAVERAFRAAVRRGVDERLRGHSPVGDGRAADPDALSDAEYYRTLNH